MSYSASITGPWETVPLIIVDQNRSALLDCAHTNPSVIFFPNGSALMAFNAGFCHDQVETIGLGVSAPTSVLYEGVPCLWYARARIDELHGFVFTSANSRVIMQRSLPPLANAFCCRHCRCSIGAVVARPVDTVQHGAHLQGSVLKISLLSSQDNHTTLRSTAIVYNFILFSFILLLPSQTRTGLLTAARTPSCGRTLEASTSWCTTRATVRTPACARALSLPPTSNCASTFRTFHHKQRPNRMYV